MTLEQLIVAEIILGAIAWLVSLAPFIEARFKSFIIYVLLVVGVLILISALAHGFALSAQFPDRLI